MRALVWDGRELRFVGDVPEPGLTVETALVRVHLAGICSTDLQILQGYMGFRGIPGHEFVGQVIEGPADWKGRRVVGEINFACHRCETCQAGRERHCPTRTVLGIQGADGAFADLVRIPVANLHAVPDGVDDRSAVFVEPLAAAFEAAIQTRGLAGGKTVVVGAGKLGLLVAQVLARRGDDVAVVCRSARARRRVEGLGLEPTDARSAPRGRDLVVDATGAVEGIEIARELVRPRGTIVLKSTVAAQYALDLAPLVVHEISLIGSRCGPFGPALGALATSSVEVSPLLEDVYPLERGLEAMQAAARPGNLKLLLEPGGNVH